MTAEQIIDELAKYNKVLILGGQAHGGKIVGEPVSYHIQLEQAHPSFTYITGQPKSTLQEAFEYAFAEIAHKREMGEGIR